MFPSLSFMIYHISSQIIIHILHNIPSRKKYKERKRECFLFVFHTKIIKTINNFSPRVFLQERKQKRGAKATNVFPSHTCSSSFISFMLLLHSLFFKKENLSNACVHYICFILPKYLLHEFYFKK